MYCQTNLIYIESENKEKVAVIYKLNSENDFCKNIYKLFSSHIIEKWTLININIQI